MGFKGSRVRIPPSRPLNLKDLEAAGNGGFLVRMPSTSHRQRGEHPWEGGHTDPSEAQGRKRERPSERSVERDPRADEQRSDMRRSFPGRASE